MVACAVAVVACCISSAAGGGSVCAADATGTHRQRATPGPGWICPTTCRARNTSSVGCIKHCAAKAPLPRLFWDHAAYATDVGHDGSTDTSRKIHPPSVRVGLPNPSGTKSGDNSITWSRKDSAGRWRAGPVPYDRRQRGLGKMLEYLDSTEDAEYQLKSGAERLMKKNIEAGLGR